MPVDLIYFSCIKVLVPAYKYREARQGLEPLGSSRVEKIDAVAPSSEYHPRRLSRSLSAKPFGNHHRENLNYAHQIFQSRVSELEVTKRT